MSYGGDTDKITRKAGADATGLVVAALQDAVLFMKKGAADKEVVVSTDGATRFEVVGSVYSIGPGSTGATQRDVKAGDPITLQTMERATVVLKSGNNVKADEPLGAAANGTVKALTLTSTLSALEASRVICFAEEAVDASSADKPIFVRLALAQ